MKAGSSETNNSKKEVFVSSIQGLLGIIIGALITFTGVVIGNWLEEKANERHAFLGLVSESRIAAYSDFIAAGLSQNKFMDAEEGRYAFHAAAAEVILWGSEEAKTRAEALIKHHHQWFNASHVDGSKDSAFAQSLSNEYFQKLLPEFQKLVRSEYAEHRSLYEEAL